MSRIGNFFAGVLGERAIDAGKLDKTRPWNPSGNSAAEDMRDLVRIRARSRDLYNNNDLAHSLLNNFSNAVVGYGIQPLCATQSDPFNELIDRRFMDWAKQPTPAPDIDFFGLQNQVELAKEVSGECFVVRVTPPKNAEMRVPLWLKVLEADLCDEGKNGDLNNGGRIVQGVEFDRYDRVTHYWFHHNHPGEAFRWAAKTTDQWIRLPARDVIHVWDKYNARPAQTRGLPRLLAVIRKMKSLENFDRAELAKQEVAACFGIAVEGADDTLYNSVQGNNGLLCDSTGRPIDSLYPGMTAYLPPGAKLSSVMPPTMNGYADYVGKKEQNISSAAGVPYALATGDLTKVNFSSSRYGQGGFMRKVNASQWLCIIPQFCERVMKMWMDAAYEAGNIQVPEAPFEWTTQPFPSVNPLQDVQAASRVLRLGGMTVSEWIAERGGSPRRVLARRAQENDLLDELGLVFDSDPRYRTQAGTNQPIYDTEATAPAKKKGTKK